MLLKMVMKMLSEAKAFAPEPHATLGPCFESSFQGWEKPDLFSAEPTKR